MQSAKGGAFNWNRFHETFVSRGVKRWEKVPPFPIRCPSFQINFNIYINWCCISAKQLFLQKTSGKTQTLFRLCRRPFSRKANVPASPKSTPVAGSGTASLVVVEPLPGVFVAPKFARQAS